ncbi:hypothetical protein SAMN05877809_102524 [Rhodobacter sp. JA431]|uniref:hypothetical protein n=1 Tax=Rhodobacter sp. JA431 TaxID=570013 RepID=UPI000BD02528|nr:hypothetical protein [Rhodobacter sp. JA431]SOB99896.1 hypothetical protein SAMN05877809_102524 [Rhodobacter sp. JA431]
MSKSTLIISALRRSGTTALWQSFRNLPEVAAFDEPFHPQLAAGARENPKGTWPEIATFLQQSGSQPVAISPIGELEASPSEAEIIWMQTLQAAAPRVAMDVVRCWNRLPALCANPQDILFVLLLRDPASWVTAHLRPSGRGTWRKRVMDVWRQQSFFFRKGLFDNYHYETIIAEALRQNHPLWGAVTLPIEDLKHAPAYVKLLAFWWGSNLASYQFLRDGPSRPLIVTLSEFSTTPAREVQRLLDAAGWHDLSPNLSHVAATRSSHGNADGRIHPAWLRAARDLGIEEDLFEAGGATAQALERAFEAALAHGRSAR